MTYELALVVVPPDTLDPIEWAYVIMDPYFHTEECWKRWQDEEDELPRCEHLWDGGIVGGHYFEGCLWRDRYGRRLPDHPINRWEDEIRRAGDIDLRFLYLSPTSLVTPDGNIHFMAGEPHCGYRTAAQLIAYEDKLTADPNHLAIPMECHS